MVNPARTSHHTYDEYLADERDSGLKHDYGDGEIYALAGGSRQRNALGSRVSAALEGCQQSVGKTWQVAREGDSPATGDRTRLLRRQLRVDSFLEQHVAAHERKQWANAGSPVALGRRCGRVDLDLGRR